MCVPLMAQRLWYESRISPRDRPRLAGGWPRTPGQARGLALGFGSRHNSELEGIDSARLVLAACPALGDWLEQNPRRLPIGPHTIGCGRPD
jgi:hypothetical protein